MLSCSLNPRLLYSTGALNHTKPPAAQNSLPLDRQVGIPHGILRLWFKELRSEIGLLQAITLPPFVSPFLLPFPLPPFLLYVLIEKNILNAKQKLSMIGSECYTPGTGTIKCQRVQLTKLYFHSKSDCQNSHDPNTLTSQAGMFPL